MKITSIAAMACALTLITTTAMAQLRDNNIPAGMSVLSGTPSGTSASGITRGSVPEITDTAPHSGRSSSCGLEPCGGVSIIAPARHHHHSR